MAFQFAPYQDESPELERAKSPPPRVVSPPPKSPSPFRSPPSRPQHPSRVISEIQPLPHPSTFVDHVHQPAVDPSATDQRSYRLEAFETSLPLRLDYEAMLAYCLL